MDSKFLASRKGFVLSISVFAIVIFAFLFSQQFLRKSEGFENSFNEAFALRKAAFVAENISTQAASMLGASASFGNSEDSSIIGFSGRIPCGASAEALAGFESFVEGEFARNNNAEISLDFSGISGEKQGLLFSNGLEVDCRNSAEDSLEIFSTNSSSMPSRIDLNIESTGELQDANAWQWQPSGDLEVSIHYKDSAMTVVASGKIDSNSLNNYGFNYSSGSLQIIAGEINGNSKSLKIIRTQGAEITAEVKAMVFLPLQEKPMAFYNAGFLYSQAGFEKSGKIIPLED